MLALYLQTQKGRNFTKHKNYAYYKYKITAINKRALREHTPL